MRIKSTPTGRINVEGPEMQTIQRPIKRATAERLVLDDAKERKSDLICKNGRAKQIIYKGWVATLSDGGGEWFIILGPYYVAFENHWKFEAFVDSADNAVSDLINARK